MEVQGGALRGGQLALSNQEHPSVLYEAMGRGIGLHRKYLETHGCVMGEASPGLDQSFPSGYNFAPSPPPTPPPNTHIFPLEACGSVWKHFDCYNSG